MIFPNIDPIALEIGPFAIRWYALAYIAGILLGWWLLNRLNKKYSLPGLDKNALDDVILWAVAGVILGGRLGYVLFYQWEYYSVHLIEIFHIWKGGMAFHGGLVGVAIAFYFFCKRKKIPFAGFMDRIAVVTPIGLMLGRIANFVNGELYGRVTDSALGIVFPYGGELPRHPSQLYQAACEGLLLFIVLYLIATRTRALEKPGLLTGLFLVGYACARFAIEFFREPDAQLGFVAAWLTMGQLLCIPMALLGIFLISWKKIKSFS